MPQENAPDSQSPLSFDAYQEFCLSTAIYPHDVGLIYAALGLTNEAGEVAGKIKKMLRDGLDERDVVQVIRDELGDVLWYAAMVAHEIGQPLSEIVDRNVEKLSSRKERGVLGGSGDNR